MVWVKTVQPDHSWTKNGLAGLILATTSGLAKMVQCHKLSTDVSMVCIVVVLLSFLCACSRLFAASYIQFHEMTLSKTNRHTAIGSLQVLKQVKLDLSGIIQLTIVGLPQRAVIAQFILDLSQIPHTARGSQLLGLGAKLQQYTYSNIEQLGQPSIAIHLQNVHVSHHAHAASSMISIDFLDWTFFGSQSWSAWTKFGCRLKFSLQAHQ